MRLLPLLIVGCGRIAFDPLADSGVAPWPTLTGQWTWISGSNIGRQPALFGTRGTPGPSNKPGARDNCGSWLIDGALWLHAGFGYATSATTNGRLNDLWRYEPSTGLWTWMHGGTSLDAPGSYGTLGQASPTTTPGGRNDCTPWRSDDALFLYGGVGFDSASTSGQLADLWRFDVASGEWTWVAGSNTVSAPAVYGTRGVPSINNTPGSRDSMLVFPVTTTITWFYGGNSIPSTRHADLWRYDATTNEWTWMNGVQTTQAQPVYGTLGAPSPTNTPGARSAGCAWATPDELWLFGGTTPNGIASDLWRYTIATDQWTWMAGPDVAMQPGVYTSRGSFDPNAQPGARVSLACWKDARGNLWLFGGFGHDAVAAAGPLNDLWVYSPTLEQWAWVSGADRIAQVGVYGAQGVAASTNVPGSRLVAGQWLADDGTLWLFGGDSAYDSMSGNMILDDLWRYGP